MKFPSGISGGDDGIRTHDPLLAGQVLSQLSYTPILAYLLAYFRSFFAVPRRRSIYVFLDPACLNENLRRTSCQNQLSVLRFSMLTDIASWESYSDFLPVTEN